MPYDKTLDGLLLITNGVPESQPEFIFNAAARRMVYFWRQNGAKTLDAFRIPSGGLSGTVTGIISWQLRTVDAYGVPSGAVVASGTATPTSYSSVQVTGVGASLSDRAYYGVEVWNNHGTPASNYWASLMPMTGMARHGEGQVRSFNTGTSWDDLWPYESNFQRSYSDGSWIGKPFVRSQGNLANALYSSSGSRFAVSGQRFRPDGRYWLHRVVMGTRLQGTYASAGTLVVRVYRGTTLIATSDAHPGATNTSGNIRYSSWYFGTPVLLEPDADYSVVLGQESATGGSASHHWLVAGTSYATYAPGGTTHVGSLWGMHGVLNTASSLSSWTVDTFQPYIGLGVSAAVKA